MKTQLVLLTLLTSIFSTQIQAQDRTIINATNSEISDNLDLEAVASIFGDSDNLQDFERRLNDPNLQISNLDLNNDNQVDYLRVIESVENQTHLIIIQDVLDRDVYQDVATIEVERDNYNNIHTQIVGDAYLYGQNYIYEPVYYNTPLIYASFWLSNYRPYYSNWGWNYYPSYYYAWNPLSIFRYRHNIHNSINSYNQYNYVNYRRSNLAINMYNSRSSNGYERQHPDYSFSRRNSNSINRYELDQRRNTENVGVRNNARNYQNRNESQRENTPQNIQPQRDYSQNRNQSPSVNTQQSTQNQRDFSQNRNQSPSVNTQQSTQNQRDFSQNRNQSPSVNTQQSTQNQRDYSQNRNQSPNVNTQQNTRPQRDYSQLNYSRNGVDASRANTQQRPVAAPQRAQTNKNSAKPTNSSTTRKENRRE